MDLVVCQSAASGQGTSSTATNRWLGFCATLHSSIQAIPQEVWDDMLPGDPESYEFYQAVEPTPPPGFRLGAISVSQGDQILAVAPTFEVDYRLDTPLQGGLRRITNWLHARVPGLMSLS